MNAREPVWWIPLLRRVLLWGALGALVAGAVAFLILEAGLNLWVELPPVGMSLGELVLKIARISATYATVFAFLGAVIGAVIAFYAPASEPRNGFKSSFLRFVVVDASKFWALSCLVVLPGFLLLWPVVYVYFNPDLFQTIILVLMSLLLVLSLWRAINRAMRLAKQKLS